MAADHIVSSFDLELREMRSRVISMGDKARSMVADSMRALLKRDTLLAERIAARDEEVNSLLRETEEKGLVMIAKRQPMASDLREIISAMRLASDIEKMADLAKNIALRVMDINEKTPKKFNFNSLEVMGERVFEHIDDAFDCYDERDLEGAMAVWRGDNAIDTLYMSLFRELLTYMMEDPRSISFCAQLLFCAKDLERISDHASAIAETVHYLMTGEAIAVSVRKSQDV